MEGASALSGGEADLFEGEVEVCSGAVAEAEFPAGMFIRLRAFKNSGDSPSGPEKSAESGLADSSVPEEGAAEKPENKLEKRSL